MWWRLGAAIAVALLVCACASAQLNYNTLDIASTIDDLISDQVVTNLAKFIDSESAIPSQVQLSQGQISTQGSITPTYTNPLTSTIATGTTIARTLTGATTTTSNTATASNLNFSVALGDLWNQNWTVAPITDSDQLWRLRALYRYATERIDDHGLLCEYAFVEAAQTSNPNDQQPPGGKPPKSLTLTISNCRDKSLNRVVKPDPAFLRKPSCVFCLNRNGTIAKNEKLTQGWLAVSSIPVGSLDVYKALGVRRGKLLYVRTRYDYDRFLEFSLFVVEATGVSASTTSGGAKGGKASGKGVIIVPSSTTLLPP
jgi:hypothetical protein